MTMYTEATGKGFWFVGVAWAAVFGGFGSVLDSAGISIGLAISMLMWAGAGLIGGAVRIAYSGYYGKVHGVLRSLLGMVTGAFVGVVTGLLVSTFESVHPALGLAAVFMAGLSADVLIAAWDATITQKRLGNALGEALKAGLKALVKGIG